MTSHAIPATIRPRLGSAIVAVAFCVIVLASLAGAGLTGDGADGLDAAGGAYLLAVY